MISILVYIVLAVQVVIGSAVCLGVALTKGANGRRPQAFLDQEQIEAIGKKSARL